MENNTPEQKPLIRSITEAFSMQPANLYVGMNWSWRSVDDKTEIAKIVLEEVYVNGDPFEYYIGYDVKGNRLFEYRKETVNVNYEI
jgi:hypothetical protein